MEWEQCKENIKPKREGRSISNINTTPKGTPMLAQIQERQAEFEREIKEYEGDDELEVWVKYVRYMEDAFPEGDYLSNVGTLQFRLIKRFQDEERYKEDPRMLSVFLNLANHSIHATDVFAYCMHHNLVTGFSKFWINWINSWIYKQRYDKALRICEKAIQIFRNTSTFRGMKVQIVHLINSASTANIIDNISEELRKTGNQLHRDSSQNQLPGSSKRSITEGRQFNIFKDRNEHPSSLPSMSTNPLETKVRNKENAQPKKQRWKNLVAETTSSAPIGEPFSIFEENSEPSQDKQKFEKSSTALKAKKVAPAAETTSSGSNVPVLKATSNSIVCTVSYHKSKVYPLSGDEWSFEEIEALKRFNARNNSACNSSANSSKRSLDSDNESDILGAKKFCSDNESLNRSSLSIPLKSCLSTSKFGSNITDFDIENTLMSSTKRIYRNPENEDSVMAPDFGDAQKLKQRPSVSLNLSNRSDSSLFQSDFKTPVEDSLTLASKKCDTLSHDHDDDEADLSYSNTSNEADDDGPNDFTFKGLEKSIGLPDDSKEQFAVYEDTVVREGKAVAPAKEPEIIKGAFSKKKLKLQSPTKSEQSEVNNDSKPVFEIFSEENKKSPVKEQQNMLFGDNFYLDEINEFDGRPSDAYKIFKKTPEKSVEESYSLRKVAMTPCDNSHSSSSSYVPCTVEKMGVKPRSNDTQVISKQVLNILNDCSTITEADETTRSDPKPYRVSFAPTHLETSSEQDEAEAPKGTSQAPETFAIFSDSTSTDTSLGTMPKQPVASVVPFSQEEFEGNKKQLTPILEGSLESNCSCVESLTTNKSNVLSTTAGDGKTEHSFQSQGNHTFEKTLYMDLKNEHDSTRKSIEATVTVPVSKPPLHDIECSTEHEELVAQPAEVEQCPLYPDKTHRDLHLDCTLLTKVPRTSLLPTEPVADPYDQTFIERLVQSLDPPLFYRPSFNQHDSKLVPKREITLGALQVKNITNIGEGAFAKVYAGDCIENSSGVSEPRAFKIQSPPCPWEFYILTELLERMNRDETSFEIKDMILPTHSIHVFNNSSVLVTSLFNEGSLLDMMNHYRNSRMTVPETVICTYTLDILRCVNAIHRAEIIHGDIKPDNLLLRDKENTMRSLTMDMTKSVVFIDFGRSIDMRILPQHSEFTVSSKTDLFECVEMQVGKPWTYQADYYGMLSCIHLMIHNEYMKVHYDERSRVWKPTKNPHRRVDQALFSELFRDLLNIPDCSSIPPLTKYIQRFEDYLKKITTRNRHQELKTHYQFMSQR